MSRQNNFDLMRLMAALQVLYLHSYEHLWNGSIANFPASIISFFPGVPIFFFMSGFLISHSWERSPNWKTYAANRILRIYPALWFCLTLTVGLALLFLGSAFITTLDFSVWLIAQSTCAQFYNLDSFRELGVGTINGSLWTISVELQFYCLLPVILTWASRSKKNQFLWILWLAALLFREMFLWLRLSYFDLMPIKLVGATLLPYFSVFCTGMLCQLYWPMIKHWFERRIWHWLAGYAFWVSIGIFLGFDTRGNAISSLFYLPLCGLVLAFAFSYCHASEKLLRGCDLSYGLYLYHMLAINFVLEYHLEDPFARVLVATIASVLLAICSWTMIEKPCMKWKHNFGRLKNIIQSPEIQGQ